MLNLYYQLSLYDKNQKLIHQTKQIQSRSFIRQFLGHLYSRVNNITYACYDITNTSRNSTAYGLNFVHPGLETRYHYLLLNDYGIACDEQGIIIGTGNTAVTPTDYKLETPVNYGTSSGEMLYYGCSILNLDIISSIVYLFFCRNADSLNYIILMLLVMTVIGEWDYLIV